MSPSGVQTIIGDLPKQETFVVESVFESGLQDFDLNVVFININDLEGLFDLEKNQREVEIYLKNPKNIIFAKNTS